MVDNEICLLKIFAYLSLKSLNTCSCVCKNWNKLTNEVKLKRKSLVQTIYSTTDAGGGLEDLRNDLKSQFNSFTTSPELSILFLTNSAQQEQSSSRASKRYRSEASNRPCDILRELLPPPSKESIFIYSSGIVGTDYKNKKTFEVEALNDEIGLSGLFFPKTDKYRVNVSKFSNQTKLPDFKTIGDYNRFFGVNEEFPEEMKYSFIAVGTSSKHKLNEFFRFLNRNLKSKVAISGGYIKKFEFENDEDKRVNLLIFSFISQKDLLFVSQIVINAVDDIDQRRELINKKLIDLKSNVSKCKNKAQLAIQIVCCSRGIDYYDREESYESKLFKQIFPEVPLGI
jgi:hypothetical protein